MLADSRLPLTPALRDPVPSVASRPYTFVSALNTNLKKKNRKLGRSVAETLLTSPAVLRFLQHCNFSPESLTDSPTHLGVKGQLQVGVHSGCNTLRSCPLSCMVPPRTKGPCYSKPPRPWAVLPHEVVQKPVGVCRACCSG